MKAFMVLFEHLTDGYSRSLCGLFRRGRLGVFIYDRFEWFGQQPGQGTTSGISF